MYIAIDAQKFTVSCFEDYSYKIEKLNCWADHARNGAVHADFRQRKTVSQV